MAQTLIDKMMYRLLAVRWFHDLYRGIARIKYQFKRRYGIK